MPTILVTADEQSESLLFNVSSETMTAIVELATMGSLHEDFAKTYRKAERENKRERRLLGQDRWAIRLSSSSPATARGAVTSGGDRTRDEE